MTKVIGIKEHQQWKYQIEALWHLKDAVAERHMIPIYYIEEKFNARNSFQYFVLLYYKPCDI